MLQGAASRTHTPLVKDHRGGSRKAWHVTGAMHAWCTPPETFLNTCAADLLCTPFQLTVNSVPTVGIYIFPRAPFDDEIGTFCVHEVEVSAGAAEDTPMQQGLSNAQKFRRSGIRGAGFPAHICVVSVLGFSLVALSQPDT